MISLLLLAAPTFVVEAPLGPAPDVERVASTAWQDVARLLEAREVAPVVRLRRGAAFAPDRSGASTPGSVEVRQNVVGVLDEGTRLALRHEVAHQVLFALCPEASEDRLFHEAVAVATSGEIASWAEAPYTSVPKARTALERARDLDRREARAAIARIVADVPAASNGLPPALARRIKRCGSSARWGEPMTALELSQGPEDVGDDALVILSRHSGEMLLAEGAVQRPMPYGSVLKPLVVAGAGAEELPALAPDPERAEWACGHDLPKRVGAEEALVRSCNGWFLDWAGSKRMGFGVYAPLLLALGLSGEPSDVAEAIGLYQTLSISPWGVAQAYRVLAEQRPDLVAALGRTIESGTLAGLPWPADRKGMGFKTGTVRDAESRPRLGWVAAVDADFVAVMVRKDRAPRTVLDDLRAALTRVRRPRSYGAARVQVFGLLALDKVEASCAGLPVLASPGRAPELLGGGFHPLLAPLSRGEALCLGGPWRVRFPQSAPEGREYAGSFALDPAPPTRAFAEPGVSERARRARRGSDIVFTTTLLRYVRGVLEAEDAKITGEPRIALARVMAGNALHPRHAGRPVCDTTHCQTFLGTVRGSAAQTADQAAIDAPGAIAAEWRPFSRGGEEPWSETRPAAEVERALGGSCSALHIAGGKVTFTRAERDGDGVPFEEQLTVPCERLRAPLRLLSCPLRATRTGAEWRFEGKGRGHGEGLDVEAAKRTPATADQLLDAAYGRN